ncbi:MAG: ATP-grasp domain-containing protein [Leptospiraceae bacterium]|nr:ATP-grasp domain-containing protein [Leptospiraceae bacterium]MDW7975681.1 ATP-grasp domain-containing protein [Leptospiraceae bacterium]
MFVSLGAGKNQIPLITALKNLQIPVIGIDQNPNSIGKKYCDVFYQNSIYDKEKIIKLLRPYKNQLLGIYTRSFGKAIQIANELAFLLELPHNPINAIQQYQDKKNIIKIALHHRDLKTQKNMIENLNNAKTWIIKPKDSYCFYAKKNIILEKNWDKVQPYLQNENFIVEPYYEGSEYIFFGVVIDGQLYPLLITQKERILEGELIFCDFSHFFPNDLDPETKYKIFQICQYIVKKTEIQIGPFLAEFVVSKNEIFFIEAAPEIGGEGIPDFMFPEILNIPYFEMIVDLYSKKPIKNKNFYKELLYKKLLEKKEKSMLIQFILQEESYFQNLIFPKELYMSPYYYYSEILKDPNTKTYYQNKNQDRLGFFVLSGKVPLEILQKEKDIILKKTIINYSENSL